jgi:hypothetical protein
VVSATISVWKRYSVLLYLQLIVEGLMSYLHYMRLFAYFNVQHILWCFFALLFFVLSTLCYQFLYIVHFWLPLRYSLTFIIYKSIVTFTRSKICIMVWVIVCSWLTAGSFLSSSEFMIMIIRSSRETQYP